MSLKALTWGLNLVLRRKRELLRVTKSAPFVLPYRLTFHKWILSDALLRPIKGSTVSLQRRTIDLMLDLV